MSTPNIEELINNLTIKAGVMEMGEKIAWGSDTALMRQAAATLQSQAERIAELERESETHAKAYGLAIVERDNLRHELKTAQEGWRCECSTDDACRFARERDALRAELGESISNHEACKSANSMLLDTIAAIAATEPTYYLGGGRLYGDKTSALFDNAKNAITELFTRPMPAQDVTELVEALEEYGRAGVGNSTDWRVQLSALRLATAALSKYKGAK